MPPRRSGGASVSLFLPPVAAAILGVGWLVQGLLQAPVTLSLRVFPAVSLLFL